MIYNVQKRKRRRNGILKEDPYYSLRYRFGDMPKDKWVSLRTSDKQVADKNAREFLQLRQLEAAGLIPNEAARNAGKTPLPQHLADYLADLKARGKTQKHIEVTEARISKLLNDCYWKVIGDVDVDGFITWRNENAKQLAAKTLNEYLSSAISLLNWMQKVGRTNTNPLCKIEKADGRGKLRRERRSLTQTEVQNLLSLKSPDKMAYFLAVSTGLRRGELEQLTWGDIRLDESAPYILARAGTTKNKKEERVALTDEIAEELASCRPDDPLPSSLVLPNGIRRMRDLKKDFEKAGIVYCDDKGLYADFHSLRHTCATYMSKNGVSPVLVKKHMRHSNMKQTERYTDESQLDVSEALKHLPGHQDASAHISAQILGSEGQYETQPDARGDKPKNQKPLFSGAQVAHWPIEAQKKLVEAVGIEPTSQAK